MNPINQQQTVHNLNQSVLSTALTKLLSNLESCQSRLDYAYARATRSQNSHIQGKLSTASLKLSELLEILDDEAIQELLTLQQDRDLLRELKIDELQEVTETNNEITF